MKLLTAVLAALIMLQACGEKDAGPQFKNFYEVSLKGLKKKSARIQSSLAFTNPSKDKAYTLVSVIADIKIEGKDVGTFVYENSMDLRSNSELKVPFSYSFNSDKVVSSEELADSYKVNFSGYALFLDNSGDKFKVSFEHNESVKPIVEREERKAEKEQMKEERKMDREARKLKRALEKEKKKQAQ